MPRWPQAGWKRRPIRKTTLSRRGCHIRCRAFLSADLGSPRAISQAVSWSRREFLRAATGACAPSALFGLPRRGAAALSTRKVVVVTFGGGARDEETFMPEGQENIPHLLTE